MDFSKIKAGDRVWVGSNNYGTRNQGIKAVASVTPTLIRLDWSGNGGHLVEFHRKAGAYTIQGNQRCASWNVNKITDIATKAECAAWDAEQLAAKLAKEAKEKADKERDALRAALAGMFVFEGIASLDTVNICNESWNDRKGFTLELHGLTEERIREIAELLKGTK